MLTSEFVSVILDFQGMSRGHQEKHPDDIVRNQLPEQRVGKVQNRSRLLPVRDQCGHGVCQPLRVTDNFFL